jgi:hypothetical protein
MVLDELEKKQGPNKNSNQGGGCFGTLIIFCGIFSAITFCILNAHAILK